MKVYGWDIKLNQTCIYACLFLFKLRTGDIDFKVVKGNDILLGSWASFTARLVIHGDVSHTVAATDVSHLWIH